MHIRDAEASLKVIIKRFWSSRYEKEKNDSGIQTLSINLASSRICILALVLQYILRTAHLISRRD